MALQLLCVIAARPCTSIYIYHRRLLWEIWWKIYHVAHGINLAQLGWLPLQKLILQCISNMAFFQLTQHPYHNYISTKCFKRNPVFISLQFSRKLLSGIDPLSMIWDAPTSIHTSFFVLMRQTNSDTTLVEATTWKRTWDKPQPASMLS